MEPIFRNVDHYVEYLDARDSADDTPLDTGTCTFTLTTAAGVPVPGGSGTCAYVGGTNGNYRGILDAAITGTLTLGAEYRIVQVFVQGGYNDQRTLRRRAADRGEN